MWYGVIKIENVGDADIVKAPIIYFSDGNLQTFVKT